MKERILNIIKLVICLLLFFRLPTFIVMGLKYLGFNFADFGLVQIVNLETIIDFIILIILGLFYYRYYKVDYQKTKLNKNNFKEQVLRLTIIFLIVKIGSAVLSSILATLLNIDLGISDNQNTIITYLKASPLIMFISAGAIAPIVEESIFRLGLRKIIDDKYVFILISGLIFGFMHIFPTELGLTAALIQSITYVSAGIFLAYVYSETDNIWVSISIHAINNIISLALIML